MKRKAIIKISLEVEFEDDGVSDLRDLAMIAYEDNEYEIFEHEIILLPSSNGKALP